MLRGCLLEPVNSNKTNNISKHFFSLSTMNVKISYESEHAKVSKCAAAVKEQVEQDILDIKLVGLLENYLDEQIASNQVDVEANILLLKSYSVYPAQLKETRVAQILAKILMILPSTAFNGATFMVSETLRKVSIMEKEEYSTYSADMEL